jgi:hypothetical protein
MMNKRSAQLPERFPPPFLEPEVSLPCSQDPACLYTKTNYTGCPRRKGQYSWSIGHSKQKEKAANVICMFVISIIHTRNDSKLLLGFPFIGHGNPDNNSESFCVSLYTTRLLIDHYFFVWL